MVMPLCLLLGFAYLVHGIVSVFVEYLFYRSLSREEREEIERRCKGYPYGDQM